MLLDEFCCAMLLVRNNAVVTTLLLVVRLLELPEPIQHCGLHRYDNGS